MKLLCVSNGHGEDAIALRILEALQQSESAQSIDLAALPIVGDGHAYRAAQIPIVGQTQTMPSGGFVYMDGKQLWRDVQGGLVSLTRSQLQAMRQWGKDEGLVLAVGDIVPLLFAWLSGAAYAFVGTAKSEYYLRDESGPLAHRPWFDRLEGWAGSVYLPWERWLMSRSRCQAVFPRDRLTSETLQRWAIPAMDLGNPMMDGLQTTAFEVDQTHASQPSTILLLPGSRSPEAERNWQQILTAVDSVQQAWRSIRFLGAVSPNLSPDRFRQLAVQQGWQPSEPETDSRSRFYRRDGATLQLDSCFETFAHEADVAIAMAGTATEQVVGLGKPVMTLAGEGPQFTPAFAEAQTRLLGPSVQLIDSPMNVGAALQQLWADIPQRQAIARNGRRRLGSSGAADRIAAHLLKVMASDALGISP